MGSLFAGVRVAVFGCVLCSAACLAEQEQGREPRLDGKPAKGGASAQSGAGQGGAIGGAPIGAPKSSGGNLAALAGTSADAGYGGSSVSGGGSAGNSGAGQLAAAGNTVVGGAAGAGGATGTGGATSAGAAGEPGSGGFSAGCPAKAPQNGDLCTPLGLTCEFESQSCECIESFARDGEWQCIGDSSHCPPNKPESGDECSVNVFCPEYECFCDAVEWVCL
jgi:hypothetical protein